MSIGLGQGGAEYVAGLLQQPFGGPLGPPEGPRDLRHLVIFHPQFDRPPVVGRQLVERLGDVSRRAAAAESSRSAMAASGCSPTAAFAVRRTSRLPARW